MAASQMADNERTALAGIHILQKYFVKIHKLTPNQDYI
jgi:hypothetical protein